MVGFARLVRACRLSASPVVNSVLNINRFPARIAVTGSSGGQHLSQPLPPGEGGFTDRPTTYNVAAALAAAAAGTALFAAVFDSRGNTPALCEGPANGDKNHENPLWRSRESQPFTRKLGDALLFTGTANEHLGAAVAERLSTRLGRVSVGRFADGEVNIQFLDSLRGKDVYIIQPTSTPVNDHLMELLLMISTCRRASAKKITAVIPYFGYARQDRKMNSRVPISAADVARMMEAMGVDRVVAVDLHCGQIQGFFGPRVPVDNVEAQIVGLDYFESKELDKPVVVSPDAGGVYRARKFQEGMVRRGYKDCSIAMLIKRRIKANEVESMDLVGSVEGRDAIIVDDMIDTAGTLVEAARELKKKGARRVYAFATHGLFSGPAIDRIQKSALEEVVITDTIKARPMVTSCKKIKILSISILLADAIRRIHQKESLNDLFNFASAPRLPSNASSGSESQSKQP
ncbi:phosphoribosylpyrophosphate synthetase, putative [Eimeria praecox]|uniref:ribose-phosphate diphosphokinase n=1 Tax=Eimeria praecox TaxID=51316 RepID=U6G881_9EIME|nr:phosphoribosylpyrophosphate synthetase, putative [Eimeria praecox]